MKFLPLLALILLCSCSANFHCKKCLSKGGLTSDTTKSTLDVVPPSITLDETFEIPGGDSAIFIDSDGNMHLGKDLSGPPPQPAVRDTVVIPPSLVYEVQYIKVFPRDTISTESNGIKIKLKFLKDGKLWVHATATPDTVRVEVPMFVENEIKTGYTILHLIGVGLIGFALGVIVWFFKK